ncbi:MAG: hypothetical protein WBR29_03355, partial [Gammaproteobacteria bacterium]
MKTSVVFIVVFLMLGGCSSMGKLDSDRGVIFSPDIGVVIYQGPDDHGIKLGDIKSGSTLYV